MQTSLRDSRERFKKTCSGFVTITILLFLSSAVPSTQDATKTAPHAYKLRFENEWVRVIRVHYEPREKIPAHTHTDTPKNHLKNALAQSRTVASLFVIFGVVSIVLAAVGLYGVMTFAVSRSTKEFGIRMALGGEVGHHENGHVAKRPTGCGRSVARHRSGAGAGTARRRCRGEFSLWCEPA